MEGYDYPIIPPDRDETPTREEIYAECEHALACMMQCTRLSAHPEDVGIRDLGCSEDCIAFEQYKGRAI